MTITLTPQEAKNVQIALMALSKQPQTSRTEMGYLINLMSKFDEPSAEEPQVV